MDRKNAAIFLVICVLTLNFFVFLYVSEPFLISLTSNDLQRVETRLNSSHIQLMIRHGEVFDTLKIRNYNSLINKSQLRTASILTQSYSKIYGQPGCSKGLDKKLHLWKSIQLWSRFADERNISWWLCCGSLLGAVRTQDFIPWDHDIDICIFEEQRNLLRQEAEYERPLTEQVNAVLLTLFIPFIRQLLARFRPAGTCYSQWTWARSNCWNFSVPLQLDACAFCQPFARISHSESKYSPFIDVFLVKTFKHGQSLRVYDDSVYALYDLSALIPLELCTLAGLRLPCPQNPETVLSLVYGPTWQTPSKQCRARVGMHWWM